MSSIPQRLGVYIFFNHVNQKVYVGSTQYLRKRTNDHLSALRGNYHANKLFQHAWNKYGEAAFEIIILEYVPIEQLLEREQYYIDYYQSYNPDYGYNRVPVAGTTGGKPLSDEHKASVSSSLKRHYQENPNSHPQKGKTLTERTKGLLRKAFTGRDVSDETRQKMSQSAKNWLAIPENRQQRIGRKQTDESRQKIARSKAIPLIISHEDGRTWFSWGLKPFCGDFGLDDSYLRKLSRSGKYYHGFICREANEEEIRYYQQFLGEFWYFLIG